MARNREQIVAQILKLTEMANRSLEAEDTDGVDHQAVADNATKKIAKLMRRHQIQEADIESARSEGGQKFKTIKFSVSNSYGLGKERASALHWGVIVPFGGHSMRTHYTSAKMDTELTIFIPASIADMVQPLLYSISLQMELGMKDATKTVRDRLKNNYWMSQTERNREILQFRRGYVRGFASTVGSRITAAQQEALDELKKELEEQGLALGSSTELVLADSSKQAKEYMYVWNNEFGGGGRIRTTTNRARASADGRNAGSRDGRKADITLPRANPTRHALVG
jgi:hypothetical protein